MIRKNIESIFSLLFFFFSSFLLLAMTSSVFVVNFDNLMQIMLKPNGFFITFTRILILCGFCVSVYIFVANRKNADSRFNKHAIFGILLFLCLFILNIISNKSEDELETILEIYYYKENFSIFNNIKRLVIDSVVFVYFVFIPIVKSFNKQQIHHYFQQYIKENAPSLDVSIIFLFGFMIQIYNLQNIYSFIDLAVSTCSIVLIIRIVFKHDITFHTFMNTLMLICGFIIILLLNDYIAQSNTYYASMLFYSIGILYWQFNTLSRIYPN